MRALFYIGEKLHKTIDEVEQLTVSEVRGWVAWFGREAKK